MKFISILSLAVLCAFGAEPAKKDENPQAAYWKALAIQNAGVAQWESSLSQQQRELRAHIEQGASAVEDAKKALAATCKPDETFSFGESFGCTKKTDAKTEKK